MACMPITTVVHVHTHTRALLHTPLHAVPIKAPYYMKTLNILSTTHTYFTTPKYFVSVY